jgi:hypothetical protein
VENSGHADGSGIYTAQLCVQLQLLFNFKELNYVGLVPFNYHLARFVTAFKLSRFTKEGNMF